MVHLQQVVVQIQFLVQSHQQVVALEVLQFHHKFQESQEDQVVVDLGKVDQLMLEQVIHPQLAHLKETLEDRVQEILVMQEAEVEEHLHLVLLPHNQAVKLAEQVVVEQLLLLQHRQWLEPEAAVVVEVVTVQDLVEVDQMVVVLEEMHQTELEATQTLIKAVVVAVALEDKIRAVEMVVLVW